MAAVWASINNEIVKLQDARLHISDLSIQRGYGVFDFLKTTNHIPLYLEDHLARFYYSAQKMRLSVNLLPNELKSTLYTLIKKNDLAASGIRITLTGGYSPDGYQLAPPNLIITQQPLTSIVSPKEIALITYPYQRDLYDVKTINYTMGIWLQPLIKEKGADDVLFYSNDAVSECPRANFFIVDKDNNLITPTHNILKGVTRKKILEVARPFYPVKEGNITLTDIRNAKEAFITSTTKQIVSVKKIDGIPVGNGTNPVSQHLYVLLQKAQAEFLSQYASQLKW